MELEEQLQLLADELCIETLNSVVALGFFCDAANPLENLQRRLEVPKLTPPRS